MYPMLFSPAKIRPLAAPFSVSSNRRMPKRKEPPAAWPTCTATADPSSHRSAALPPLDALSQSCGLERTGLQSSGVTSIAELLHSEARRAGSLLALDGDRFKQLLESAYLPFTSLLAIPQMEPTDPRLDAATEPVKALLELLPDARHINARSSEETHLAHVATHFKPLIDAASELTNACESERKRSVHIFKAMNVAWKLLVRLTGLALITFGEGGNGGDGGDRGDRGGRGGRGDGGDALCVLRQEHFRKEQPVLQSVQTAACMQVVDALSSWQRANGGAQQAAAERLGREGGSHEPSGGGSHEPSGGGSHEPSERSTDAAEELKVLLFSLQQLKAVCTVCRDYMVARATADSPHAQLSARALARDLGSVAYALSSAPPSTAGLSKLRASFEACVHVLLGLGPSARPGGVAHASAATAGHGCAAVLRFWRRSTTCELKPPPRQHDVDGAAASAEQDVKGLGLAQLLLCALRCCTTTGTTLGTELIAEAVELLPAALEALSHRHARIFAEGEAPSGEAPPEALRLIEHSAAIAAAALERAPTQMRAQMFIRLVGLSCARQPLPRLLSAELFRRALGALPAAAAAAQLCALWRVGCCMLESEIERTGGCDLEEEAYSKGRQLDQRGHRTHDPLSPDSNLLPLYRGHLIGEPTEEVDREHGSVQACRLLRMLASTFPHLAPPAQERLLDLTAPPIRHAAAAAAPDACDDRSLAAIWAALILLEALPAIATPRTGSHLDLGRFQNGLSALLSAVELHPVGGGSTPPPPRSPISTPSPTLPPHQDLPI